MAKLRKMLIHPGRNESGQGALAMVLILLMLGAIILTPLLVFMSTGLKAGQVYESKMQEFYAADAGVEDGLWQIKYDHLDDKFTSPPYYDLYDYDTNYSYSLDDEVNNENVTVNITNVWIPYVDPPGTETASDIIESGALIVTGNVFTFPGDEAGYQVKISYYYNTTEGSPYYDPDGANLEVDKIGVWLYGGFDYVPYGSGSLNGYDSLPDSAAHCGGKAIVWDVDTAFKDLPGGMGYPLVKTLDFQFSGPSGQYPQALSWIETSGVGDLSLSWDADSRPYKIESTAGSTTAEAYVIKNELRKLGSAIPGEYRAIGNSLMTDEYGSSLLRDTLLSESDAEVYDIPSDARVDAAYLYWSAWLEGEGAGEEILFGDKCENFNNWDNGTDWGIYRDRSFEGHHSGSGGEMITMKSTAAPDLSGYPEGNPSVSWQQWEEGRLEDDDCLLYSFSGDDGGNWSAWQIAFCGNIYYGPQLFEVDIPGEYLTDGFTMRFKLQGFDGGSGSGEERCRIDNIKISAPKVTIADISVKFEINDQQVYFDEEGEPQQGYEEITASKWAVLENQPGEYSYACYLDVTELVQAFCDKGDGDTPTGNGRYTVGGVDGDTDNEWSYAAWSLIIIYSSAETQGHQLYLYDDFVYATMDHNVDFDGDGEPGGTISGFLVPDPVEGEVNAAKISCFVGEGDDYYNDDYMVINADEVEWNGYHWTITGGECLSDGKSTDDVWNSWSYGLSEDGIDIDTFYVTWDSGLLEPGDTSAQIDLPTETDSWNLVYIILSFRSDITTGGTVSYLIRGG